MRLQPDRLLPTGDRVIAILTGGFSEVAIIDAEVSGRRALKRIRDDILQDREPDITAQFVRECNLWSTRLANAPYIAKAFFALQQLGDLGPALFMEYYDVVDITD
jgi:hypothetical protein